MAHHCLQQPAAEVGYVDCVRWLLHNVAAPPLQARQTASTVHHGLVPSSDAAANTQHAWVRMSVPSIWSVKYQGTSERCSGKFFRIPRALSTSAFSKGIAPSPTPTGVDPKCSQFSICEERQGSCIPALQHPTRSSMARTMNCEVHRTLSNSTLRMNALTGKTSCTCF